MDRRPENPNPLTFPKSSQPFSYELFKKPTSEYRGCPLWAWNTKLDKGQLRRQIDAFKEMGLGGFHMHVRVGLDTEYMGDEFMDLVKFCVDYAEEKGLLACLYDDDRWPSGVVGGNLIAKYPEHKVKHILFTPNPYGTVGPVGGCAPSSAEPCRSENGHLLARYSITLDRQGNLAEGRMLSDSEPSNGNTWYAYVETNPPSPWFNGQTYVDTLSPDAISRFIEMSYERYKEKVGDRFGSTVPCSFTDEPQFAIKRRLPNPTAKQDIFFPWTNDLPLTFQKRYGSDPDLISHLPELAWNLPGNQPSVTRYRFHDHVCDRFVSAYMDQIGEWCRENNILLNGHMMEEPTLSSQTSAIGEAMRCYRKMGLPGIDLLADAVEFNTAKQASSVARQNGARACGSETYGCTHWTFSFEGHKGCSDWQAALGINFRVQHLAWVSMAGEGKRDYPASINYQSPWYKEYGHIEDYFARVNVALTRGTAVTRVGVIHPIESYWLCFGPEGAGNEMARRDQAFGDLTSWLLHGLVDFDFISESLLPDQFGGYADKKLHVGACAYDVIILSNLRTLRSTTFRLAVQGFLQAGGDVIVAGEIPTLIDAQPRQNFHHAAFAAGNILPWDRGLILSYLDPYRDIKFTSSSGGIDNSDKLLYQMREDGEARFVFICNTDRGSAVDGYVSIKGAWNVMVLDTFSGDEKWVKAWRNKEWTVFPHKFEGCESLLLRLVPAAASAEHSIVEPASHPEPHVDSRELSVDLLRTSLSDHNVLLLDKALYRVNDGNWAGPQEILQADNDIRDQLHLPRKGSTWRQPWCVPKEERAPKALVVLKFSFESEIDCDFDTFLALEVQDYMVITMNGIDLTAKLRLERQWWVDESITKIPLEKGTIKKGTNTLMLEFPFGLLTDLERVYILGPFSVKIDGPTARIDAVAPRKLSWGSIAEQGLPFYAGNVDYEFTVEVLMSTRYTLCVPDFSSPVLRVDRAEATGWVKQGNIAIQPRSLRLGGLGAGKHTFRITAFGNRFNAFGHVHVPDGVGGCWPDMWRSKHPCPVSFSATDKFMFIVAKNWIWTDGYNVKPIGVLTTPNVVVGDWPAQSNATEPRVGDSLDETPEEESVEGRARTSSWVVVD